MIPTSNLLAECNCRYRLRTFVEPPDADPHVRWCGEGHPQGWPLPDLRRVGFDHIDLLTTG